MSTYLPKAMAKFRTKKEVIAKIKEITNPKITRIDVCIGEEIKSIECRVDIWPFEDQPKILERSQSKTKYRVGFKQDMILCNDDRFRSFPME